MVLRLIALTLGFCVDYSPSGYGSSICNSLSFIVILGGPRRAGVEEGESGSASLPLPDEPSLARRVPIGRRPRVLQHRPAITTCLRNYDYDNHGRRPSMFGKNSLPAALNSLLCAGNFAARAPEFPGHSKRSQALDAPLRQKNAKLPARREFPRSPATAMIAAEVNVANMATRTR